MSKKETGDLGKLLYVSLDNFLVPAHFFCFFSPKSVHHTYLFTVQLGGKYTFFCQHNMLGRQNLSGIFRLNEIISLEDFRTRFGFSNMQLRT